MSYRVYVNGVVVAHETTIASAKALVTGLRKSCWVIAYTSKQFESVGIMGSRDGKIKPFFNSADSEKFLKTFVRSRAEKDANNTTYVERDFDGKWVQIGTINKLDKLLISMGF